MSSVHRRTFEIPGITCRAFTGGPLRYQVSHVERSQEDTCHLIYRIYNEPNIPDKKETHTDAFSNFLENNKQFSYFIYTYL